MSEQLLKLQHMVRYGTVADQKFISEFREYFQAVIINGNILAHIPSAMADFVGQNKTKMEFIVDPLTHAFQHDIEKLKSDKGKLKSSIKKLLDYYGSPVKDVILSGEVILPDDFNDDDVARDFCKRVLQFQTETIDEQAQEKDFAKYLNYVGINKVDPVVLVAPYFYMTYSTFDEWLNVNLKLLRLSKELNCEKPLFAQIVVSRDLLLDESKRVEIVKRYSEAHCDGVLLWIDDFSEYEANLPLLESFVDIIIKFCRVNVNIYNLYGGYFSILLTKMLNDGCLSGVCHGLEYGESRGVIPVGGGIPTSKYYYFPLHKRIRYGDAARLLLNAGILTDQQNGHKQYYDNICKCPECQKVIGNDINNFSKYGEGKPIEFKRKNQNVTLNYPTTETKAHCLRHYLNSKNKEFNEVNILSKETLLKNLSETKKKYQRQLGLDQVAYFENWKKVLEKF